MNEPLARGDTACGIRTLSAKVVVRLLEPPSVSAGGLLLPEAHRGRSTRGIVVAFGPGREYPTTGQRVPPGVELGDVVVFTRGADVPVFDDRVGKRTGKRWGVGGGYVVSDVSAVISQEEILCVVDDFELVESVKVGEDTYDVVPPVELSVRYLPGRTGGEFDDVVTVSGEFYLNDSDFTRAEAVAGAVGQFVALIEGYLIEPDRPRYAGNARQRRRALRATGHLSPSGQALRQRLSERVRVRPC